MPGRRGLRTTAPRLARAPGSTSRASPPSLAPAPGLPPVRSASVPKRQRPPRHLLQAVGRVVPPPPADMFDACGSCPADLVFVPTLACRGVGGPVVGDGAGNPRRPTTPTTARFAPSPSNTGSRRPDGQGLPLS